MADNIFHCMYMSVLHFANSHLLAVLNNAEKNNSNCFEFLFSIIFGMYLGIELLGHMIILYLSF